MSVHRHDLVINGSPVIKVDCKYHHTIIILDIFELLLTHCCGFDYTGLSSKEQHNTKSHRCFGMFLCPSSSLQINTHATSIHHFISLYCISVIPGDFPYLGIIRLLYIRGRYLLSSFYTTFSTLHLLWFLSWGDFIYSKYCIFLDAKLVERIQHGLPVA